MATRTITTKLELSGEREYRAKLKNINAELTLQKSELEKIQAQYNLDLDGILVAVKQTVPDTGVKIDVPILGSLTFYSEDVERLAKYIKEA